MNLSEYKGLSEKEKEWLMENEAYVSQDNIKRPSRESLEAALGEGRYENACHSEAIADYLPEDQGKGLAIEELIETLDNPIHKLCLYERGVCGRSSTQIANDMVITATSRGKSYCITKTTSQVNDAIKAARKILRKAA